MAKSQTQPQATDEWGDEIGAGTYIKWDAAKVVVGILTEAKDKISGKYNTPENPGYEAALTLDDGEVVRFNCPAALASRMKQVAIGTRVRIEYDGTTVKSAAGRDVKNFSVRESKNGLHAQAFAEPVDRIPA